MDHVDSKFIGLLSPRLEQFKKVKGNLYNFRCPICGDSKKNKNKTRGYLYQVKTNTNFKCHNCGASMSLNNFLRKVDVTLHKQYSLEKFKEGYTGKNFVVEEPKLVFEKPVFVSKVLLPLCSEDNRSRKYLEDRGIDPTKFYYAEKFKEFVNSYKQTFGPDVLEEPRIVIPLFYDKELVGFQGRSLNSKSVKYITVMLNDDSPKIYGLDTIRRDSPTFITEGPFDSTFIRNSIAMCGADADVSRWGINDPIWIYDNEPRSPEIVRRIKSVISSEQTNKVVIWPSNINEKDINEMVLSGHDVQSLVELNTYSGLQAKLQFNIWKKI